MADFDFCFSFVPRTYADMVQRAAVLYPITKRCKNDGEVLSQTARLVRIWRARVCKLQQAGWYPACTAAGFNFLRNCRPAFVGVRQPLRCCCYASICPFCYARWVRTVWERVDAVLFAQSPANQQDFPWMLVEQRHVTQLGYKDVPDSAALEELLVKAVRSRQWTVEQMAPLGAFSLTTVEPAKHGYRLTARRFFQVSRDFQLPDSLLSRGKFYFNKQPNRRAVVRAVVRACRYPRWLLRGDIHRTVQILNARASTGVRLTAMFKSFRRSR